MQKTNQEDFRVEKAIKRKGNKIYVKLKDYDNFFSSWTDLLQSRYCTNVQSFSKIIKNTFFYLFCKYFEAISVASSVQVTLQFYSQIFYSTAPNKIVIRLTKRKNTNCQAKVS